MIVSEKNPIYFHGVGSFDAGTGEDTTSESPAPTYTQVFGNSLLKMAKEDDRIIAVTAAMPEGTGLTEFAKAYPDRFLVVLGCWIT